MSPADGKGTLIEGTLRNEDLLPCFLEFLINMGCQEDKEWALHEKDLMDMKVNAIGDEWWLSEEAHEIAFEAMCKLDDYGAEGTTFGAHPWDGSDFGWWEYDE